MVEPLLRPKEILIGDHNWQQHVDVTIDGEKKKRGLVPRDYRAVPHCSSPYSVPFEKLTMPIIPRSEWVERIKEMNGTKSRLSDVRRTAGPNGGHIPSLDQDGVGYCWNHSATMGVMLDRAVRNMPYVRLSAFMIGCLIKNYRDEGGWGAQALDFIVTNGVPAVEFWAEKSMNRSNDTPEMRANARLHRVAECWVDLEPPVYNRNLSEDQAMTCLLNRQPVIGDFNWWGHSVILMDPMLMAEGMSLLTTDFGSLDLRDARDLAIYQAAFGKRGLNSWTDSYGDLGEFTLTGSKAILDGGAAICSSFASAT